MQNSADIEGEYRYKILTITNLPQKSAAWVEKFPTILALTALIHLRG